ncbi:hypothetical protein ONZ45_g1542 [Pleurotus djamor]|nr:hypothetical protein ONZ45_g1542 [Pleurotus djamor]
MVYTVLGLSALAYVVQAFQAAPQQIYLQSLDPYPNKPRLTFRDDGTFKITVFSDLHFGENPWDDWGPEQDRKSLVLMRKVLGDEGMDYAVINGDLITGENTFRDNSTLLVDEIMAPFNEAKVPFSSTHGNHDNQANITHLDEIRRELRVAPLSYTRIAPPGIGGADTEGPGNYWVPIYRSKEDEAPALVLWFFDSRGGFSPGHTSHPVSDWVHSSVATYISEQTRLMDAAWGPGHLRSAIAFVHIPPYAIQAVQKTLNQTVSQGLNADSLGQGSTQASGSAEDLNKDTPWWDALNSHVKNLKVIISGHDHGNEWCARERKKGVIFCFDKHSGYGGYGDKAWNYGVRNILFRSPSPNEGIETWIRLEEGETRARAFLDENFDP